MKLKMTSVLLCLVTYTTFSQQVDVIDSLTQTPQQQFSFITQNMDLTEVTSGLLEDKAFKMLPLEFFNGQVIDSTNLASAIRFGHLFATLSSMPINQTFELPLPSDYSTKLLNTAENVIPMGAIHYQYHKIKDDAINLNLLSSDGAQLSDVPNRPASPYESHNVFLSTPLKSYVTNLNNDFMFRSDLYYSNLNKTIALIQVDFDDSLGYKTITGNVKMAISYATYGVKIIKTKITYTDNSVFESHAKIVIVDYSENRYSETYDFTHDITATQSIAGEEGSAELQILLACGHENIQKPLIWIEGFNPPLLDQYGHNLNYDYMLNDILGDYNGQINSDLLNKHLENEGYDLIYVDFADGGDWIQKNALVVHEVIRWVNQQKQQNGSTEKNVVIGESMGGLIAKYALRTMELAGEDHAQNFICL